MISTCPLRPHFSRSFQLWSLPARKWSQRCFGEKYGEQKRGYEIIHLTPESHRAQLYHFLSEFMSLTFTIPSVKWAWPLCFPFSGCADGMCVKLFTQIIASVQLVSVLTVLENQSFSFSIIYTFHWCSCALQINLLQPTQKGRLGSWKGWQFCDQRDLGSNPLAKLFYLSWAFWRSFHYLSNGGKIIRTRLASTEEGRKKCVYKAWLCVWSIVKSAPWFYLKRKGDWGRKRNSKVQQALEKCAFPYISYHRALHHP